MAGNSKIAYTLGEPAGIGTDIILQSCAQQILQNVVCIGDPELLQERAKKLGIPLTILPAEQMVSELNQLSVLPVSCVAPSVLGTANIKNAKYVLTMLDMAIEGCLNGQFSSMVTGPIHKGIINDAGIAFSGHTEYLAEKTGSPLPVMMLATEGLRVALLTTHLPLKDVSQAINKKLIIDVCRIVYQDLHNKFAIKQPNLLMCGLNPHAGEGGHIGTEEIDTIIPALEDLRKEGLNIEGPLPADTLFTPKYLQRADAVVAMYHDQGLPVLKYKGFGSAANITLGLPIIRTSVDHGTAFDLAGTGETDIGSLLTAIEIARQMVESN